MNRTLLQPMSLFVSLAMAVLVSACATTTTDQPKLVDWQIESSHPFVMAGGATETILDVEVTAALPEGDGFRIPLNLSIAVDHSGSMTGAQMEDARRAVLYMLSELQPDDTVSVVAFSTQVDILLAQTEWSDVDVPELTKAINELKPRGTTAMHTALAQSYQQILNRFDATRINRVILLSDGIPNDATQIQQLAQTCKNQGISITTMGLGPYYNEDLMAQIADVSGGNYRFIKESKDIETFFLAEKKSMEQVVARNVTLQFNLGPGIELVQTLGNQANLNGRQVVIPLGELGAADSRHIALKVRVKANASGSKVEVSDVKLGWEDVVFWSGYYERWQYIDAEATKDQVLIEKKRNKIVVEKAGRLHAAWEMDQAVRAYEAGFQREAKKRMERAAMEYREKQVEAEAYLDSADAPVQAMPAAMESLSIGSSITSAVDDLFGDDEDDEEEDKSKKDEKKKVLIKRIKARSRAASGR